MTASIKTYFISRSTEGPDEDTQSVEGPEINTPFNQQRDLEVSIYKQRDLMKMTISKFSRGT
jgi:hypothetical protein